MKRFVIPAIILSLGCFFALPSMAAHPGSLSDCGNCHLYGKSGDAPKVTPPEPGFFEKLIDGKQQYKGHPTLSCVGAASKDARMTGCHAPESGFRKLLVMDTKDKPMDAFCVSCHPSSAKFGAHHPSYKTDKNADGVGDTMVRPVPSQEVFGPWAPANRPAPLSKYPDALLFSVTPEGVKKLESAIPLETTVEKVDDKLVTYTDVITCITCHNPHFGYLVELQKEEPIKEGQVGRVKGDALLRLRDFDNALCMTCH